MPWLDFLSWEVLEEPSDCGEFIQRRYQEESSPLVPDT